MSAVEPFELFALRYARHTGRRHGDNFLGSGDFHESNSDLEYFVWIARRPDRLFLIDTGFAHDAAKARGRELLRLPAEGIRLLGVDPDEVEDIVITHLHYDHAGTLNAFPRARFHVQDAEAAYATGRCMCHKMLRIPFSEGDVQAMVKKVFAYRCEFHDGADELAPGITVHKIGGHSKGLQCVRVKTKRGYVVVASDCCHLYSHMDEGRVFPITYSIGDTLEGYRTLLKLASSRHHFVPGHDPEVMKLYPAAAPGLEGWIARLDVAPKV